MGRMEQSGFVLLGDFKLGTIDTSLIYPIEDDVTISVCSFVR
jgi:hypothetical protein